MTEKNQDCILQLANNCGPLYFSITSHWLLPPFHSQVALAPQTYDLYFPILTSISRFCVLLSIPGNAFAVTSSGTKAGLQGQLQVIQMAPPSRSYESSTGLLSIITQGGIKWYKR